MMEFNYTEAFSRNLGWISEYEQLKLKDTRVAIAGMGGVGGIYLLTCVRMGIEKFNLSEFDHFELGNFNRQIGSSLSSIGQPKLDVMIKQALQINPNLQINTFPEGINADNTKEFLENCSVYLDGIDLFEVPVRRMIFKECERIGIPGITCAPVAMGFAQLVFADKSPSFDEFFNFDAYPLEYDSILFLAGITPRRLHMSSLHDPSRIHFFERKVTSTIMGCQFCASAAVTEAIKHILDRGNKIQAPHGLHYDAHSNIFKKTVLRWGNKGPLQRLKIKIGIKSINERNIFPYPYHHAFNDPVLSPHLRDILELARWAPSGHNEQLCHVNVNSPSTLSVQVTLPRLYADEEEIKRGAYIHFGIYFESLKQAASLYHYEVSWTQGKDPLLFHISLKENPSIKQEQTALYLRARFTDRRSYKTTPLNTMQIDTLMHHTLEPGYHFSFKGSFRERFRYASSETKSLNIELTDAATLQGMLDSVDFKNSYSPDKLPFESINLSVFNKFLSKKIMQHPRLMTFFNKLGASIPVMLDYAFLPNLRCAGHFVITRNIPSEDGNKEDTWIKDGQMIQRFWLKATSLGLTLQPSYFQIIISRNSYFLAHTHRGIQKKSHVIREFLKKNTGTDPNNIVFMGRLGIPKDRKVYARSTRR